MGLGIARRSFLEGTIWPITGGEGPRARRPPADPRAARRSPRRARSGVALGFECAAGRPPPADATASGLLVPAAKVRLCRFGVEAAARRSSSTAATVCEDWPLTRQLRDAQCHPSGGHRADLPARRPARHPARHRHEAALARIDRAIDAAGAGPSTSADAVAAVTWLVTSSSVASTSFLARRRSRKRAPRASRPSSPHGLGCVAAGAVAEDRTRRWSVCASPAEPLPAQHWNDRVAMVAGRELLATTR